MKKRIKVSPPERQHIYEEEKMRAEASAYIKWEARRERKRRLGKSLGYLALFFVVAGGIAYGVSVYRYYDGITDSSLSAEVQAKHDAEYQRVQSELSATGGPSTTVNDAVAQSPLLYARSQSFNIEDGYCIVSGEVKNISPGKLANVEAVATFYDKNKNVIKTDDALIEYNPILPGQTSPFRVGTTGNPAIKSEVLTFAFLGGAEIPMRHPKTHW